MSIISFLILLFVASVCGSIGAAIAGVNQKGCLANIALGFIGAIIGTWLSNHMGIKDFWYFYKIPVIWSIIGSALFVWLVSSLRGDSNHKKD